LEIVIDVKKQQWKKKQEAAMEDPNRRRKSQHKNRAIGHPKHPFRKVLTEGRDRTA